MNSPRRPLFPSAVELLESRISPAALLTKVVSYTDEDGDKVTVTIKSPGTIDDSAFLFDSGTVATTGPHQLQEIDLHGVAGAAGASITVKVKHEPGGDGLAAIGLIDATGENLGAVSIAGDLGAIDATSTATGTPAIKSLTVQSLGRYGLLTQPAGGSPVSHIDGGSGAAVGLGSLTVATDVTGAFLEVTGSIGPVHLGGSLVGGSGNDSGEIAATTSIGAVHIGGDVTGGSGMRSGFISAGTTIGSVSVKGSLLGGTNDSAGEIKAQNQIGAIVIGHDVVGSSGQESGYLESSLGNIASVRIMGSLIGGSAPESGCAVAGEDTGAISGSIGSVFIGHDILGGGGVISGYAQASQNIGNVTVGGSVIGGTAFESGGVVSDGTLGLVKIGQSVRGGSASSSGYVASEEALQGVTIGGSLFGGTASDTGEIETYANQANLGPVKIGHNVIGASITGSDGSLVRTGYIGSGGSIASVTIGGSIFSGIDDSTSGSLAASGSIRAETVLGSLTVGGSLVGHDTANGASPVTISAQGPTAPSTPTTDVAIGHITIHGRVEWSQILAGYSTSEAAANGDAQIGAVTVGGNWIASTLVAGVENTGGIAQLGANGGANDEVIPTTATTGTSLARIASIVIGGSVIGDATGVSTDHFGFASANPFPVKIHGVVESVALGVTPLSPLTGDTVIDRLSNHFV